MLVCKRDLGNWRINPVNRHRPANRVRLIDVAGCYTATCISQRGSVSPTLRRNQLDSIRCSLDSQACGDATSLHGEMMPEPECQHCQPAFSASRRTKVADFLLFYPTVNIVACA